MSPIIIHNLLIWDISRDIDRKENKHEIPH